MRWAAFMIAIRLIAQTPATAGDVTGCVTDTQGQVLPRVTIRISRGNADQTVLANADGCYEVKSLPAGSYTLFANLAFRGHEDRRLPGGLARAKIMTCRCLNTNAAPAPSVRIPDARRPVARVPVL